MIKIGKWLFLFGCVVLLGGCAGQSDEMYTWQNYSYAQYQTQKSPGEKSLQSYQKVLEEIIQQSERRGQQVPPGVYASLGWLYARQNAPSLAIHNFIKEKETYPEATVFVEQLIKQSTLREDALDEDENAPAGIKTPAQTEAPRTQEAK